MTIPPRQVQIERTNPYTPTPSFSEIKFATPLRLRFSYDSLKEKGIYVFSYRNGKSYALSKTKPLPSYFWKRLEYLPEKIELFEIRISPSKRDYMIKVTQ